MGSLGSGDLYAVPADAIGLGGGPGGTLGHRRSRSPGPKGVGKNSPYSQRRNLHHPQNASNGRMTNMYAQYQKICAILKMIYVDCFEFQQQKKQFLLVTEQCSSAVKFLPFVHKMEVIVRIKIGF